MRIMVIKKGNGNVKTMSVCPWVIDEPPTAQK